MSETDKKNAVITAATRLFLLNGYGGTSMEAIAAEAGVAKQTLYSYFSGKDDLFRTIIGQRCVSVFSSLPQDTGTPRDIENYMRALARRLMDMLFTTETLGLYRLVVAETPRFPELGRTYYEAGPQAGVTNLAAFLERHGLAGSGDSRARAEQFFGMLAGHFLTRALLNPDYRPSDAEREAFIGASVAIFLMPSP